MKRILLSLVAIATITLCSYGQAPEGFKYQAVVRDAGNTILNNQAVGLRMTIQQGSIGGTTVYSETFSPTTNAYGLVNLEIGNGTVVIGTFANIDWSAGPYFMETAVDVTGGTNYFVMGTSQLMSVPYALYAKNSGNGQGPTGPQGATGAAGPAGINGAVGATGATGAQGIQGLPGINGTNGAVGPTGLTGPAGAQGLTGPTGAVGLTGPIGSQGATGSTGPTGLTGATGATGAQGIQGLPGTNGTNGAVGATGAQGIQGLPGTNGTNGAVGATGAAGPSGASGTNGTNGQSAYQAAVTNGFVGTEAQWLTSLQGATGSTGATGPTGSTGATGAAGAQGIQGLPGPSGASGANGTNGAVGATGAAGPSGASGTNGTNGQSAYQAAVTNGFVGTEAQWLTSLQGATGSTGATGPTGSTGAQGIQGLPGTNGTNGAVGATGAAGTNAGVGGFTHYLGEAFNGGIIYYLYKGSDGLEHGLIVALTESNGMNWQSSYSLTGANRAEDGAFNTALMTTNSPVAAYIATLGAGWYLPSIGELILLEKNIYSAQKGLRLASGATLLSMATVYWSSTEDDLGNAYAQNFSNDLEGPTVKGNNWKARGIKAF